MNTSVKSRDNIFKTIAIIICGTFLLALSLRLFIIPKQLADGGIIGVSILVQYALQKFNILSTDVNIVGSLNFLLNIPILIISYRLLGKKITFYSIISLTLTFIMLYLTESVPPCPSEDILLNSLFAGILSGLGLGIIFRSGGTTAGIDILASILNKYFGWGIAYNLLIIDLIIIIGSIPIIGLEKSMYTLVYIFVTIRVINFVIEGLNTSKTALVITEQPEQMAAAITQKMDRGVTIIHGAGGYTGDKKKILYVILTLTEIPLLKKIVLDVDRNTFMVINHTHEILGKGFSD